MIDLHTHHARCGHAQGSLEDVARQAYAAGVRVFAWTDHAPLFAHPADHPRPRTQMPRSEWPSYLAEADEVRARLDEETDGFEALVGAEADFLPGTEEAYRRELASPALDYVLGSVHEVGSWHIYKPETWHDLDEPDVFHREYWRLQRASAESGMFDAIAHLDAIAARAPAPSEPMAAEIERTLDCIADCGVAVEINGSGLRKAGRLFPSHDIVAGLVRRGVPITIGSDAHRPSEVGRGYPEGAQLLRQLGRHRAAVYRRRRLHWVDLP